MIILLFFFILQVSIIFYGIVKALFHASSPLFYVIFEITMSILISEHKRIHYIEIIGFFIK